MRRAFQKFDKNFIVRILEGKRRKQYWGSENTGKLETAFCDAYLDDELLTIENFNAMNTMRTMDDVYHD